MDFEKHELLFAGAMVLGWVLFATSSPEDLTITPILAIGLLMIALGNLGYGYLNYRENSSTIISDLSHIGFGIGMAIMGAAGLSLLPTAPSFYMAIVLFGIGVVATIYTQLTEETSTRNPN